MQHYTAVDLRDRRADRQVARHPRRGPARELGGHRVRRLVQRPPRLPRPRVRPVGEARGGDRQRQRRRRRHAHPHAAAPTSSRAPTSPTTRSRRCARAAIEEVVVLGRRGPAQAAFTSAELRELGHMRRRRPPRRRDVELDPVSQRWLDEEGTFTARKNVQLLREFAARQPRRRAAPDRAALPALAGRDPRRRPGRGDRRAPQRDRARRRRARCGPRAVDEPVETIECGLVLRSVGYRAVPLPDVPFDERHFVLPNERGRVLGRDGERAPRRLRRRLDQARPDRHPRHQQARRRGDRRAPRRGPARRAARPERPAARRSTRCSPSASPTSSPSRLARDRRRRARARAARRSARGSSSPRATSCSSARGAADRHALAAVYPRRAGGTRRSAEDRHSGRSWGMLRLVRPAALALGLLLATAAPALGASGTAPGAPGAARLDARGQGRLRDGATARQQGLAHARQRRADRGLLPRPGHARALRDLDFVVTDGATFADRETRRARPRPAPRPAEPDLPAGRPAQRPVPDHQDYATDPARRRVLVDVRFDR